MLSSLTTTVAFTMYNQAVHKQGRQHAQISQLRGVSELTLLLHKLQVCCPPGTYSASTALHDVLDTHYSTSVLALAAHLGEDHCRMKYHESATRVDVPVAYATCRCTACKQTAYLRAPAPPCWPILHASPSILTFRSLLGVIRQVSVDSAVAS